MPCNSDYMEPNRRELNSRLVAAFIKFVANRLPKFRVDVNKLYGTDKRSLQYIAKNYYGYSDTLDELTSDLCSLLSSLGKDESDHIVYNGKDKHSRALADWWEEHQEADRKRIEAERKESNRKAVAAAARAKLSPTERKALGIE